MNVWESDNNIFCYSGLTCITSTDSYNWTLSNIISTDYRVGINDVIEGIENRESSNIFTVSTL